MSTECLEPVIADAVVTRVTSKNQDLLSVTTDANSVELLPASVTSTTPELLKVEVIPNNVLLSVSPTVITSAAISASDEGFTLGRSGSPQGTELSLGVPKQGVVCDVVSSPSIQATTTALSNQAFTKETQLKLSPTAIRSKTLGVEYVDADSTFNIEVVARTSTAPVSCANPTASVAVDAYGVTSINQNKDYGGLQLFGTWVTAVGQVPVKSNQGYWWMPCSASITVGNTLAGVVIPPNTRWVSVLPAYTAATASPYFIDKAWFHNMVIAQAWGWPDKGGACGFYLAWYTPGGYNELMSQLQFSVSVYV